MASPTVNASTAAVAGLSTTSPVGTAVGDLVVVYTWERAGAGIPTHTLAAGFVEFRTHGHNDGSTDGRLSVAGKIATASGAQSYQAYTSSVGTDTWTGCTVIDAGTYGLDTFSVNSVTQTGNGLINPGSVTLDAGRDTLVIVIGGWHLGSDATVTPTAPTNYNLEGHVAGSDNGELAAATRALSGAASEDPGTFGDDVTPNGTASVTLGLFAPLAAENGWTLRQARSNSAAASASTLVTRIWPPLADSLLTASIKNTAGGTVSSIADGDSNTWTASAVTQVDAERVTIGYAEGVAEGDTAIDVTITFSGAVTNRGVTICEWVGAATSSALAGTNSKNNASETTVESNAVTPSVDGCLFLGLGTPNSGTVVWTPGTGYREIQEDTTVLYQTQWDTQTTAASKESIWTLDASDDATCVLAVFKPVAGAAFTLPADGGTYALTGTAASLELGALLDAAAGSYLITGAAASLQHVTIYEKDGGSQRATVEVPDEATGDLAYPGDVTAGNLLVCIGAVWERDAAATSVTVTDTRGTDYTSILGSSVAWLNGFTKTFIAYGVAPSSGANTVTVDTSGSTYFGSFSIDEFVSSRGWAADPIDVNGGSSTGASTAPSDGITTVEASTLILAVANYNDVATSITPNGAFTQIGEIESNVNQPMNAMFRIVGSSGAYTASWTLDATDDWGAQTLSLKEAPPAALAADGGSYVISGTAASLEFGALLDALGGSYTITGSVAALRVKMAAGSGAYTITGTVADLLADRIFPVDPGAYLISGTAASLEAARIFSVDGGTYLLSGTVTSLEAGYRLSADSGTYLLTGSDAGLISAGSFLIGADGGVYLISGTDANLVLTPVASSSYYAYHRKRRR